MHPGATYIIAASSNSLTRQNVLGEWRTITVSRRRRTHLSVRHDSSVNHRIFPGVVQKGDPFEATDTCVRIQGKLKQGKFDYYI